MQPDNQERWANQEKIREKEGAFYPKVVARYKQPSTKACKRFESINRIFRPKRNKYNRTFNGSRDDL